MSDDNAQPTKNPSTQEQIRQIKDRVNDLTELLRSQREMLKQRGMNLPSGAQDNLRTLKTKFDSVSRIMSASFVELQSLRALAETTALINSSQETSTVLNQVMDTVISLTGAERGYIVLKNRETGELDDFRVARGMDQESLGARSDDPSGKKNEFIVSRTIVNQVASSGEPVLTDNASADERYAGQQSIVGFALRSILAVPLKVREEVIGVVYCDNRIMSGLFDKGTLDLLAAFANQAGVAIENARLFETTRAQIKQINEMREFITNIFNSIIGGVITINIDGLILTSNTAALKILNVERAVNMPIQDVFPEMPEEFYTLLNTVFEKGKQQLIELQPVVKGLGKRYWNVIVSPLRDNKGATQGIAFVLDDLTEQKAREAQLTEVRRYLPLALVENLHTVDVSGEEREISVIATDVRGFTSFSEKLQPERLMEIINKYLSVASDGINLYEGIVDKYMGDAVTGLFNTQLKPQPDHAVRAVRAAMAIIYDLHALHEVLPEDQRLYFGIGVHTASAFLGNVGGSARQEFSAIGEAATISKILEGHAGRAEVIISEATYQHVKDMYEFEEREPDPSKAKGVDIASLGRIYRVVRRKKGTKTGPLLLDPELADLLKDLGNT